MWLWWHAGVQQKAGRMGSACGCLGFPLRHPCPRALSMLHVSINMGPPECFTARAIACTLPLPWAWRPAPAQFPLLVQPCAQDYGITGVMSEDVTEAVLSGALIVHGINDGSGPDSPGPVKLSSSGKKHTLALGLGLGLGLGLLIVLLVASVCVVVWRKRRRGSVVAQAAAAAAAAAETRVW